MITAEHLIPVMNRIRTLVVKFIDDRCTTHASALAFSSLLSVVPFLALLFAILKSLNVHATLAPVILSSVTAGSHETINRILVYVSNTRVTSLGVVGLVTLLMSVLATIDNLEEAFNQVCGIERGKPYHHKLRDYLILILGAPLLIALAVSATSGLQHQGIVKWLQHLPLVGWLLPSLFRLVPYLSVWVALLCCYLCVPNTRIRVRPALIGSLIAGTLWQIAHWAFVHFQIGVSRYNAIYGTLALLPAFMLWLLTGWCIVLAGMQIVWHIQTSPES